MLTALYRHFDSAGVLLYVGISLSPIYRLAAHIHRSPWVQSIDRVSIEWLPSREAALAAELAAIRTEMPLHNIAGKGPALARKHEPAQPAAAEPKPPRYVDRPEMVAAHFNVSVGVVQAGVRAGLPRERTGHNRFRYELGACEAFWRANAERTLAERVRKKAEAAAGRQEEKLAAMARALSMIGARH